MTGAEGVGMQPQAQEAPTAGAPQGAGIGLGADSSPGASRRNQPYLGYGLLASRMVKKLIGVVLTH